MARVVRYDFDMVPLVSAETRQALREHGIDDPRLGQSVALFRDPAAIAALRAADPLVREIFHAAGFGLTRGPDTVAAGLYRDAEAAERTALLARLRDLVPAAGPALTAARPGAFSLEAFLAAAARARPLAGAQPCSESTRAGDDPAEVALETQRSWT